MTDKNDCDDDHHQPKRDGLIFGTPGNDLIDVFYTGDPDGDRVDHNDAIIKGDGPNDDRIFAFAGDDTVFAGVGNDTVYGGSGDDSLFGGSGNDLLLGESGDDTLFGGSGNDTLFGDSGNDVIFGDVGSDSVSGGAGNDFIDTSGGFPRPDIGYPGLYPADPDPFNDRDIVDAGSGNDTIFTGDDADRVDGGTGNDFIDGGVDADTLLGGNGNDTIIGGEGSDSIDGGQGNDLIYGGYGPNVPDAVNIRDDQGDLAPGNGRDFIEGGGGDDTIFGMDDADTVDGGNGDDQIDTGIDNDQATGGNGRDTLTGGQGADTLFGGSDRDLFLVGGPDDGFGDVIDGDETGNDFDTLDLRGSGPFHITYSANNPENGRVDYFDNNGNITGTLTFSNIENVIPCFTPGTLIATPKGEIPVERLKAGDSVVTRDNGIQPVRWIGDRALGWHDLMANPHLRPVLIRQGCLGHGLPERDMMVSPNHRMLVANDRTALYFDEHEVLVAAKHLVAGVGIDMVNSVGTTYIHFMCDRHEVVLSNGAWTETFQPGDQSLKGMGNSQRSEIFELFPELKTEVGMKTYAAARRTLKRHEALLIGK